MSGLREVGFSASPPEGAYYLFADYRSVPALAKMSPTDAAMHLIEEVGVATVPGDNFYGHRQRGGSLPPVRVLPLDGDDRGRSRTAPRQALNPSFESWY